MSLGRICSHEPTILGSLVGQAIATHASRHVRYAILEHELDGPTLRGLLAVARHDETLAPMAVGLEGERCFMLDLIQHTHTSGGIGSGTLLPAQADDAAGGIAPLGPVRDKPRILNLAGLVFAGRREITEKANEFYDEAIRRANLPRQQRLEDPFDKNEFIEGLSWRFLLLKIMIPALGRAVDSRDGAMCDLNGTQIMFAIELFNAENGRYPQALSELTPGILPELPPDPYSADGFMYRLIPDDEHGRPYLLYSVGADGEDNGGRMDASRRNSAFNKRDGAGLDHVINALRPVE
jgi:hypothetical protein